MIMKEQEFEQIKVAKHDQIQENEPEQKYVSKSKSKNNTENESTHEPKHENCFMSDKCLKYDICPMGLVQKILSGKRKILILWYLSNKVLRFNDLKKKLPDVTQKMLTQQLRSLEEHKLIYRHVYPVVPPKVEYGLTDLGKKIIPILEMMHEFGAEYLESTLLENNER